MKKATKPKFVTWSNYKPSFYPARKYDPTVVTVQNEALTVQEMYERSMAGQTFNYPDDQDHEMDHDDIDLDEFRSLDLADQQEIILQGREKIKDLEAQIGQKRQQKQSDNEQLEAMEKAEKTDSKSIAETQTPTEENGHPE